MVVGGGRDVNNYCKIVKYGRVHVLMRDEKEERKKQARSNKQTNKAKQHSTSKATLLPLSWRQLCRERETARHHVSRRTHTHTAHALTQTNMHTHAHAHKISK